jgi:hypothetical protein
VGAVAEQIVFLGFSSKFDVFTQNTLDRPNKVEPVVDFLAANTGYYIEIRKILRINPIWQDLPTREICPRKRRRVERLRELKEKCRAGFPSLPRKCR